MRRNGSAGAASPRAQLGEQVSARDGPLCKEVEGAIAF